MKSKEEKASSSRLSISNPIPVLARFRFSGSGGKRKKIKAEHKVDSVVSVDEEIKPRRHRVKRIAKKSLQNIADSKTKIQAKISKGVKKLKDSKTKLQDNLASHVRESLEKIRKIDQFKPEPVYDEFVLEEENRKVRILKNAGRASFEKIRESQLQFKNRMLEGGEIMEAQVKRSIEKVKRTKNKIKANVKRSLEKLEEKRREQMRKAKVKAPPITPTSEETDIAIKVKKDSLVKFKENMAKKKVENDWICHKECEKGTCIPEECFERLKRKKARLNKLRGRRHMASMSEMRKRGKVVGTSSKNSSFKIQAKGSQAKLGGKTKTIAQADVQKDMKLTPTVSIKRLKQKTKGQKTSKPSKADVITKTNFKRTKRLKSLSDQRSSSRQAVRIGSSFSFNIEFYKNRPIPNVPKKALKQKNDFNQSSGISISRTRKVKARRVKVGNSGSQVIIQRSKNVITQKGHALKRCFCTLKLKKKRRKPAQTQRSVSTMSSIRMKDEKYRHKLLPYECEPGICVPGKCNPYECLKLQNRRQTHSKQSYTSSRKTKSTSSVTPKVRSSKAKQVQSAIMPRRKQVADREKLKLRPRKVINKADRSGNAVRIGSAFSFNIEFYKNTGSTNQLGYENKADINSFSIRPRVNYTQERPHKRNVKLREKQKKRKISTTGTETVDYSDYIKVRDTSTKTENRIMSLLPYECEPFTCIPGECDPYMCLERIKRRNKNTREVSLGTISPENKSTSSYTQSRSKAAFVQYKPSTQERKILVKSKPVKKARQTQKSNVILGNTSKQAVNIGSSFSFNIEFSKNISNQAIEQDLKSSVQPINISTRHRVKQKGILIEKRKVGNADTQIRKVKQSDKSSIVGPMLKRCFCTLNLYKKQKRDYGKKKKIIPPSSYTVNTALIPNVLPRDNKPMDLEKNEEFLESLNINRSALRLIPTYSKLSTKQSLAINSDLSLDVKLVRKSFKMKQCISKESSHKSITFNNSFLKEEKGTLTGISQYIKRCFCAMNVQYETRKLKAYECEPGICIPGQCNPYECQKLIMKRLQKGYSKLSGTDSISRSISSSQTRIRRANESHMAVMSSSRPSYNRKQAHYRTVDGQKTKSKVGHKQAVRVGSTFSFDVEFYKNRPCLETKQPVYYSPSEAKLQKIKPRPRKMRGKNIYTRHPTSDSESQYFGRQMKHRGSQGLHNLNRCFCTLKLHKKGRFHGVGQAQTDLPKKLNGVRTVEKGQNTKALRMLPNLLPYECEPGICVPGECNPYECLARINKRNLKEMGTGTIRTSASASSNTIGPYRKYKSRGVRVKQRDRPIRHADKVKVVKTSHSNKRQAVRIGSTFSFNIDFYKDKTQSDKAKYKKQEKVEKVIIKPERVKVPKQKKSDYYYNTDKLADANDTNIPITAQKHWDNSEAISAALFLYIAITQSTKN
ncbi:unnamed protein product [Leptosia nina]|uniref:Uncharacterized protein n=1 Tax=Leptosia nina TaxID=320188 RepID=A0AAV1JUB9_9NEOP